MNKVLSALLGGCLAATLSLTAQAQAPQAVDCSKARDPQRCEARQKARAACKDKARGPEHRQCVEEHMPPPDCSKARNPERCTAMQAAREACKGKTGPEHRQCLRGQAKPAAPAPKP